MARNKIFISYSHKDEKFFNELLVYLKPWQDRGILDVWTDLRIQASQKWHEDIQQAVHSTAVAVLLISPDFMASDYIQKNELPPFLQPAEEKQLALACLYIRPSQVADDDYAFTVTLDSGETKKVKLSDYQGLNNPDETLAGKFKKSRDRLFNSAAAQIKALYKQYAQPEKLKPSPPGQRHELIIRLECQGGHLYRSFYSHQTRLASGYSAWPPLQERLRVWKDEGTSALEDSDLAMALFETLSGAGQAENTTGVLQQLFPKATKPTPIFSPVRVRIQTTDPFLAELPWTQTAWNGQRLWDSTGWTFELVGEASMEKIAAFPNSHLHAPCPVLLIAPKPAYGGESHLSALEGRLDHVWPAYRERPPHVKTRTQLADALKQYSPCIIYYYGRASGDGKTLRLALEDGPLDVSELPNLWKRAPQILFFNLLEDSPISLGTVLAPLHTLIPLVIAQTWRTADMDQPRQSAKNWFLAFLKGGEDPDPIALFHQHGLATAQLWGRYGQWRYNPQVSSPREKLARLLLDRENQRRAVQGVVSALVNDSGRRLSCLLAYGDESDLVHLFVEQLLEYLRLHSKREAHILPVRLNLPPADTFTIDQVQEQVRHLFSLNPRDPLRKGLEKHKPPTPERTRRLVLLLDWGVRGTEDTPIDDAALRAWVEFCANRLCEQCPSDMRLLSILTLQRSRQQHDDIATFVEQLSADPQLTKHAFTMEELHPLGDVRVADLNKFLKDEHTSCPKDRISDMPKLIWQKTQGQFNETVDLIEEAENAGVRGWLELYKALKDSLQSGSSAAPSNE